MRSLLLILTAIGAHAGTVTVPASNYGSYHSNGTFGWTNNHGVAYSQTSNPPGEMRNFFVFDLTGLAGKITGAKLRAYNPTSGFLGPGSEVYTLFDVSTALDTLIPIKGGVNTFTDLGTGTQFGSVTVTATANGTIVEVTLNSAGVAYLNSANGKIAIGGALTALTKAGPSETLFNNGTGPMIRELVLTTNTPDVPCSLGLSPTTLTLASSSSNTYVDLKVLAGSICQWNTINNNSWVSTNITSGTGSATITVKAQANPSSTTRFATLTIGGQTLNVQQAGNQVIVQGSPLRFVSMTPCRLVETRQEYNFEGRGFPFGPPYLAENETRTFTPSASSICQVPSSARAFVFNVTAIPRNGVGVDSITMWPAGESMPQFYTLRTPDAQIVANSAIVKAGVAGGVSVYTPKATDLIVDISGYFTENASESNLAYYPLTPCRVIETRAAYRPQAGEFGPPSLAAKQARSFRFPNSSDCSIPSGASAYSVTITVVPKGPLPFLTAWPSGANQPNVSTINSPAGRVLSNSVILPAGTNAAISLYAYESTDVIVDINGYFAPDNGNGLFYYPVTQCRMSSTYNSPSVGPFGGPGFADSETRTIPVPLSPYCTGVPTSAKGYALNATVSPGATPMPFLTAWPSGKAQPNASVLNAFEGQIVTNAFIVPAGANSAVDVYTFKKTQVVVDLSGYFGR
ncbi:MAG: BACON domain-containing protein [Acidobacteria bacterium]|nr:BACON domain-containing protein [Acidobacteriota bacterium]